MHSNRLIKHQHPDHRILFKLFLGQQGNLGRIFVVGIVPRSAHYCEYITQ